MRSRAQTKILLAIGLVLGTSLASLGFTVLPAAAKATVPGMPKHVSAYGADAALIVSWTAPSLRRRKTDYEVQGQCNVRRSHVDL